MSISVSYDKYGNSQVREITDNGVKIYTSEQWKIELEKRNNLSLKTSIENQPSNSIPLEDGYIPEDKELPEEKLNAEDLSDVGVLQNGITEKLQEVAEIVEKRKRGRPKKV